MNQNEIAINYACGSSVSAHMFLSIICLYRTALGLNMLFIFPCHIGPVLLCERILKCGSFVLKCLIYIYLSIPSVFFLMYRMTGVRCSDMICCFIRYVDLLLGEFKHYKTRLAHGGIRKEVINHLIYRHHHHQFSSSSSSIWLCPTFISGYRGYLFQAAMYINTCSS